MNYETVFNKYRKPIKAETKKIIILDALLRDKKYK